ncbi:hypothetical protein LPB73_19365 [Tardiphaga sp. 37S4]|jgi:hypothetical protein|uniref:hypothetical protein n=1 Tax=Tardiphaga sp. 37S4 TaxID=1404741 RepID=UPI000E707F21|nr:hypothetical protein [Tardiphaga sp. 37S4]UFS74069.1 hypothetical protein LPB73_19365 [Tardiphaga sp. 37S4]
MSRVSRCLIDIGRMIVGLIAAIVIAPLAMGILLQLSLRPTGGLAAHLGAVVTTALLTLVFGVAGSFKATVFIALPGILFARWVGIMSPAMCMIGGAITGGGFFGISASVGSSLPTEWGLIGAAACGGSVAALAYWWLAERHIR